MTKEIEENARWKEETAKRIAEERKELETQTRISKISKFNPDLHRSEFENMSPEMFEMFLAGLEKKYNDGIEAEKKAEAERIENERITKLSFIRENEIAKFYDFTANIVQKNTYELGKLSDEVFSEIMEKLVFAKKEHEARQLAIKAENERLEKEAAEKEKQLQIERAEAARKQKEIEDAAREAQRIADEKAAKERAEADKQLQAERDKQAALEAELKSKRDAEIAAQKEAERIEAERKAADEKAAKAPIKTKLNLWVDSFEIPEFEHHATAYDIKAKFEAFKKWAKSEVEKI
jgi:hypothetical protein